MKASITLLYDDRNKIKLLFLMDNYEIMIFFSYVILFVYFLCNIRLKIILEIRQIEKFFKKFNGIFVQYLFCKQLINNLFELLLFIFQYNFVNNFLIYFRLVLLLQ